MPNQTESCGSPPKNKPHEGTKLYTSAHKIVRGVQALQHLAITGMGKIKHFILCIFFSSTYCHLSIPFHRIQNFHNFEQLVGICAFCQKLLFNYMSFIRGKKKKTVQACLQHCWGSFTAPYTPVFPSLPSQSTMHGSHGSPSSVIKYLLLLEHGQLHLLTAMSAPLLSQNVLFDG